jgi:hypothetical protein
MYCEKMTANLLAQNRGHYNISFDGILSRPLATCAGWGFGIYLVTQHKKTLEDLK